MVVRVRSKNIEEDGGHCGLTSGCLFRYFDEAGSSTRRCHLFPSDVIDIFKSLILTRSNGESSNASVIRYQGRLPMFSYTKDVRSSFYWSVSVLIYPQLSMAAGLTSYTQ